LELLTEVSTSGVGSETLGNSPSKESLDKWTRSLGHSSFTEWRKVVGHLTYQRVGIRG
jgi:hypothetical protein